MGQHLNYLCHLVMGGGQAAKGRGARKGGFGTSISSGGNAQRGSKPMAMGGGQAGMRGDDGIPGGEVARDEAITRFLSKTGCELSPVEGIEFEVMSVSVSYTHLRAHETDS